MSVPNSGTMRSPEETKANVTMPDSITNAQNATIPNAISDCPSIITGFARTTKGAINKIAMARRALMLPLRGTVKAHSEVEAPTALSCSSKFYYTLLLERRNRIDCLAARDARGSKDALQPLMNCSRRRQSSRASRLPSKTKPCTGRADRLRMAYAI